jgi:uncharacterized OsmC-like protein
MQKEAIVASSVTNRAWRLASDEGPYLNGNDVAPCPLAFLTTGMVSSYMNETLALAKSRGITVHDIQLVLDNYYTMQGSALRGTMMGGALPVELEFSIKCDADEVVLQDLLYSAVAASPINGLMRGKHTSLFTLTVNGNEIPLGRVAPINRPANPYPVDCFEHALPERQREGADDLFRKVEQVESRHGVEGGAESSLKPEQSRTLHARGTCSIRADGMKEIEQQLFSPRGSTFRFLSDEPPEFGGKGQAPDAGTYISAGIGFCFMTQLGRYAQIVRKNLDEYRIVQDTHFSLGGSSGRTGEEGTADPVETHVYLTTTEDEDFARSVLDMGEQTCFLHAFCRTDLKPKIRIQSR